MLIIVAQIPFVLDCIWLVRICCVNKIVSHGLKGICHSINDRKFDVVEDHY